MSTRQSFHHNVIFIEPFSETRNHTFLFILRSWSLTRIYCWFFYSFNFYPPFSTISPMYLHRAAQFDRIRKCEEAKDRIINEGVVDSYASHSAFSIRAGARYVATPTLVV